MCGIRASGTQDREPCPRVLKRPIGSLPGTVQASIALTESHPRALFAYAYASGRQRKNRASRFGGDAPGTWGHDLRQHVLGAERAGGAGRARRRLCRRGALLRHGAAVRLRPQRDAPGAGAGALPPRRDRHFLQGGLYPGGAEARRRLRRSLHRCPRADQLLRLLPRRGAALHRGEYGAAQDRSTRHGADPRSRRGEEHRAGLETGGTGLLRPGNGGSLSRPRRNCAGRGWSRPSAWE